MRGIDLDAQTRCAHDRSALDVVALRMRCCGNYYACRERHDALADHPAAVWPPARSRGHARDAAWKAAPR